MHFAQIGVLAIVQGLAELLPVSSSAHVIFAEKLMGLEATTPEMTFLLVMLHCGTMFAVIAYFWSRWKALLSDAKTRNRVFVMAVTATIVTGATGLFLKHFIEKDVLAGKDIENLFGNLKLIAVSLFAAGVLILVAGIGRWKVRAWNNRHLGNSILIGLVQGLCLPFRGFSRSGATISTGLIAGMPKAFAEDFSFILAVILTPPVIAREVLRLRHAGSLAASSTLILNGCLGMLLSFAAGLLAIWWLSRWLERGRWAFFGVYCLIFSGLIFGLLKFGFI